MKSAMSPLGIPPNAMAPRDGREPGDEHTGSIFVSGGIIRPERRLGSEVEWYPLRCADHGPQSL